MKGEVRAADFSRQLIPSSGNPAEIPGARPSSHPAPPTASSWCSRKTRGRPGGHGGCAPHATSWAEPVAPSIPILWRKPLELRRGWGGCLLPGERVVGLRLKSILQPRAAPRAAPRAQPLCSVSAVGRGVGLCLDMVFPAAAECCCAIPGLCVVCGTLSTRVGLWGGQARLSPRLHVPGGSSASSNPSPSCEPGGKRPVRLPSWG